MKSKFSTSWISSKQPRKQRKFLANAPLHIKHKFLSANLSKTLREKYGKRNIPVRKGDEVLVMRGKFSKKTGKISSVEIKRTRVAVEGLQRNKKDGTKVNVFFHPSSLQIQELNLEDKKRLKVTIEEPKEAGNSEEKVKKTESPKDKGEKKNVSK